jgi:hypothetical protein
MYGHRKIIDIILSSISTGHKSIPNHIRDVSHPMYDGQELCKVNSHISRFRTQGLLEIFYEIETKMLFPKKEEDRQYGVWKYSVLQFNCHFTPGGSICLCAVVIFIMGPVFSPIILQPADKKDSAYNTAFPNTGVVTVVVGSRRSHILALFSPAATGSCGPRASEPTSQAFTPIIL